MTSPPANPAAFPTTVSAAGAPVPRWPPSCSSGLALAAAPLRGRAPEVRALAEVLDDAIAGKPAIALIEGEAGIGKTRLLDCALDGARMRSMQVAHGRAEELEENRPFGLVAAVFGCDRSATDPRRAAIADLLAGSAGDRTQVTVTSDPGLLFRAVDAFTDLAEGLALEGPLVIGLDDLQRADCASLLTVGAVARRIAGLPVALIGCLRPLPRSPDLDRLCAVLDTADARRISLVPLAGEAVRHLVADVVAAEPGPALLAETAGAGGNPLFVTELVGALLQDGSVRIVGGRAEVAHPALPPTLRLTILRRLSFLPEGTVQALRAASILGSSFSLTDLATISSGSAMELSALLADAVRSGMVEDDGTRLRFRHDLIRDALYEDLPGAVRVGLHREAGQRLAAAHAPALQVAEHLARGATPGDPEAIRWLTLAAREAGTTSPAAAADLLTRAAGLMDPGDPGRDTLLSERAGGLVWAARLGEAETACRQLLGRGHDPAAAPAARIYLAHALLADGRAGGALRELERVARSASPASPELTFARAVESFARLNLGDLDGAWSAAAAAQSAGTPARAQKETAAAVTSLALAAEQSTSLAVTSQVLVAQLRGDLGLALQIADDLAGRSDRGPGAREHMYRPQWVRGLTLIELDRLEEAGSTLQESIGLAQDLGLQLHLPSHQVFLALERFTAGDWDDALVEAEAGLELAEEVGHSFARVFGQTLRSLILLHRNNLPGARDAAQAATAELAGTDPRYRSDWAGWAWALVLEAEGQPGQAYALLADCWDRCARLGHALEYRVLGPELMRLAIANGDRERVGAVAAAVTELAERNEVPSLTGVALRCQGLAGDDKEILAEAVNAYQPGTRPLELAAACEDAGAAFARQGMAGRARPLLEQALAIYEHLDADRDLARAEAALREAGIRRGRRGRRDRPQLGWPSLTPAEQAVARLVADGLSNPQIGERLYISRRTVQTHLAHVFAKLDIASRAQVAAEVARHPE